MKWYTKLSLACVLFSGVLSAESEKDTPKEKPNVDVQKLSQAFGNFLGKHLNSPAFSFDVDSLIQGIRDGVEGKPSPMTEEEYQTAIAQMQENAFEKISEENLQAAESFLQKNASEPGVQTLDEGKLQMKVVKEGSGETVEDNFRPEIRYKGSLLNGEVFGSSEQSGSVTLNLNQTIPGFRKGIIGMKEGEKRILYIHPDMAYGVLGQLPPNSLLIFEVEVEKANTPPVEEDDDLIFEEDMLIEDAPSAN